MQLSHKTLLLELVKALGEEPLFKPGDRVKISARSPLGHYRVPSYIRGRHAVVETVIKPAAIDNEQEGFGLNAGVKRHYYRIGLPLSALWPGYPGRANDALLIEVYESWLELL